MLFKVHYYLIFLLVLVLIKCTRTGICTQGFGSVLILIHQQCTCIHANVLGPMSDHNITFYVHNYKYDECNQK